MDRTSPYILSLEKAVADLTAQVSDLRSRNHAERASGVKVRSENEALRGELGRMVARVEALEEERGRLIRDRNETRRMNRLSSSSVGGGRGGDASFSPRVSAAEGGDDASVDVEARVEALESENARLASAKQESDRKLEGLISLLRASEDRCLLLEGDAREREMRLLDLERLERHAQELCGMLEEERGRASSLENFLAAMGVLPPSPSKMVTMDLKPMENPFREVVARRPKSLDLEEVLGSEGPGIFCNTSPLRRPSSMSALKQRAASINVS
ncbi:hypothetical protein HDU67_005719, partial [Dinochytrium kinnereticum]